MVKRSIFAILSIFAASNIWACYDPAGSGQCGPNGIGPRNPSAYGGGTVYTPPSPPPPRIVKKPDSFAAMANSPKSGKVFTVTDYLSSDAAKNAVIYKCQQATGEKCFVVHSFRNGCMTAISGTMRTGGALLFPESAPTGREAEEKAMTACKKAVGIIDCLPVFEEPICSFF
ncbi:DUF4189 domain-containing protein [Kingella oralis]|uniref:DUF4189 domain-containing protein n=1 Tax=Kingella oralis TaxID=505 RepID=UPI0034E61C6A